MDQTRRQEIALALMEKHAIERGIPGLGKGHDIRREAGQTSKELGDLGFETNTDELVEFYKSFVPRVLGRIFGYQHVSVNMDSPRPRSVSTEQK